MKKLKLTLKDKRDIVTTKNLQKPYYLFLEIGKESFYFSNKMTATKWLKSFEKEINFLIIDIFKEYNHLYKLNISLLRSHDFITLRNYRNDLNDNLKRYSKLLNYSNDFSILREVKNFMFVLEHQNHEYLKFLRKNNRFQSLYSETLSQKRNIFRLKNQIKILFSSTSGLKKIKPTKKTEFLNFLRIA